MLPDVAQHIRLSEAVKSFPGLSVRQLKRELKRARVPIINFGSKNTFIACDDFHKLVAINTNRAGRRYPPTQPQNGALNGE